MPALTCMLALPFMTLYPLVVFGIMFVLRHLGIRNGPIQHFLII
jgi:hypothetical protein